MKFITLPIDEQTYKEYESLARGLSIRTEDYISILYRNRENTILRMIQRGLGLSI